MNPRNPLSKSFAALLILVLLPSVASAQMPQFDSLYVFGDSLADNGNVLIQSKYLGANPPVPPSASPHKTYFKGRFSNGYVGFEYLWHELTGKALDGADGVQPFLASPFIRGAGAVDFAYGGTGTAFVDQTPGGMWAPGLRGQVELFRFALGNKRPSDGALYAIATGSNDYRVDAFNEPMAPKQVVRNIEDAIVSLYRLGARNVMVLDMPNLGMLPGADPAESAISTAHNRALYPMLAKLQARLPTLHLILIKLEIPFNELVIKIGPAAGLPALEALFPTSDPKVPPVAACLFIAPVLCPDAPFNMTPGLLFWDVVHPTTEAHEYLADHLFKELKASYD